MRARPPPELPPQPAAHPRRCAARRTPLAPPTHPPPAPPCETFLMDRRPVFPRFLSGWPAESSISNLNQRGLPRAYATATAPDGLFNLHLRRQRGNHGGARMRRALSAQNPLSHKRVAQSQGGETDMGGNLHLLCLCGGGAGAAPPVRSGAEPRVRAEVDLAEAFARCSAGTNCLCGARVGGGVWGGGWGGEGTWRIEKGRPSSSGSGSCGGRSRVGTRATRTRQCVSCTVLHESASASSVHESASSEETAKQERERERGEKPPLQRGEEPAPRSSWPSDLRLPEVPPVRKGSGKSTPPISTPINNDDEAVAVAAAVAAAAAAAAAATVPPSSLLLSREVQEARSRK